MGLKDRIIETLGLVSVSDLEEIRNRSYEAGFYDGGNDDPAQGDFRAGGLGYKKLSDRYIREGKIDYNRALETAWDLWQKSPIAKRVLAMKRDHVIGHNARPDTNDTDLLVILNEFWKANKMDKRASEFTMQFFGFGEQIFPAFVRESDGRVRIGYIDPASIHKVVKHPENSLEDWAVIVQKYEYAGYTTEKICYRIIREAEDYIDGDELVSAEYEGKLVTHLQANIQPWELEMLASYGQQEYAGSCFYNKVNAVSNQSRGMSDLLQVGDWVDQADDVLFSLAEREQFAGYFSFDVTLNNADDSTVIKRSKELRNNPPEKGSVNVHNDAEMWQMWSPDLHQTGSVETFRAVLGLILGGMGFPVHWYGYGDDANRATATVQADPTAKSLEHDQGIVEDMFLTMCQFAADQAEIAGAWSPEDEDELEITLSLPEVSTKDLSRVTASIQGMVMGLINAQDSGWITKDTAAKTFASILAEMDIQYDVSEELEKVEEQEEEQELDSVARMNGQLQLALAQQEIAENGNGGRTQGIRPEAA